MITQMCGEVIMVDCCNRELGFTPRIILVVKNNSKKKSFFVCAVRYFTGTMMIKKFKVSVFYKQMCVSRTGLIEDTSHGYNKCFDHG